ncbi:MAG: hypothetical protein ABSG57_02900 [Candidatus Bathyarchaeia archaeon]
MYPIVARKLIISAILSVLAFYLFVLGASAYQGLDGEMVRAVYFSGAAIVFAIAIIPWMTK